MTWDNPFRWISFSFSRWRSESSWRQRGLQLKMSLSENHILRVSSIKAEEHTYSHTRQSPKLHEGEPPHLRNQVFNGRPKLNTQFFRANFLNHRRLRNVIPPD